MKVESAADFQHHYRLWLAVYFAVEHLGVYADHRAVSSRYRNMPPADGFPPWSSAEGQAASALLRMELEKYGCGFPVDVISTIRNRHAALQVWPTCAYLHAHALKYTLSFAGLDNRTEAGRAARVVIVKEHSDARHAKEKVERAVNATSASSQKTLAPPTAAALALTILGPLRTVPESALALLFPGRAGGAGCSAPRVRCMHFPFRYPLLGCVFL